MGPVPCFTCGSMPEALKKSVFVIQKGKSLVKALGLWRSLLNITVNYNRNILLITKILSSAESTFKRYKMSNCTSFPTSEQVADR